MTLAFRIFFMNKVSLHEYQKKIRGTVMLVEQKIYTAPYQCRSFDQSLKTKQSQKHENSKIS